MRIHDQHGVGLIFAYPVGAGADRLAGIIEPARRLEEAAAGDDFAAARRQPPFHRHVGRRVDEAHGVAVDHIDPVERGPEPARHRRHLGRQLARLAGGDHGGERQGLAADRWARLAEHPLGAEAESHVLGGQFVAVMELHAAAQGQLHRAVVDAAPFGGEAGDLFQLALVVHADQRLGEHDRQAAADIGLFAQAVQRIAVAYFLNRDRDDGARVGLGDGDARQRCGRGQGQRVAAADLHHPRSLRIKCWPNAVLPAGPAGSTRLRRGDDGTIAD